MPERNPIIKKIINAKPKTYIIFFGYDCSFSILALDLLRNSNVFYKGYDIYQIPGGMAKLLDILSEHIELIGFNINHKTKPIIFYNGKFIGGYAELSEILS